MKNHKYTINLEWIGNEGYGTLDYKSYNRNHKITVAKKYDAILGSSDPAFMGDVNRYNPEELFLASIAGCHMLWYLHFCSVHAVLTIQPYF
ncbi:OsmC family protein [Bizionia paragorgiae]|uniref:OsmC family protein n=1 Tax=Bizionia paragorgiae TaxID=283786 RepID=UPI003A959EF5